MSCSRELVDLCQNLCCRTSSATGGCDGSRTARRHCGCRSPAGARSVGSSLRSRKLTGSPLPAASLVATPGVDALGGRGRAEPRLRSWPRFPTRYGTRTASWPRPRWSTRSSGIASGRLARARSPATWDRTPPSSTRSATPTPWLWRRARTKTGWSPFRELLDAAADELRLPAATRPAGTSTFTDRQPRHLGVSDFLLTVATLEPVGHIGGHDPVRATLRLPRPATGRPREPESPLASGSRRTRPRSSRPWRDISNICSTATEVITTAWPSCITRQWNSNCDSSTPPAVGEAT